VNVLKSTRRLLHWHNLEPPVRLLLIVLAYFVIVSALCVFLPGCQAAQPIAECIRSPRLMEAWGFQTCMTGPWSTLWIELGAAVEEEDACGYFNVLVLPRACEAFDRDGDGDVDLTDFAEKQNGN